MDSIVDVLIEGNYLKQLALVKANMSAQTFLKLCAFVKNAGPDLIELDISQNTQ